MNMPSAQRLSSLGLILGAVVVGLVGLELGLRIWMSTEKLAHWPNFVLQARTVHDERENARMLHDPLLGYAPRPLHAAPGVTFDGDGLRLNGDAPNGDKTRTILAVGDSYTFGDEITDGETWPAHLQRLTGRRTLNAGVSGYGFDQSVLRAERLASTSGPSLIVVSFIADDIRRTELSRIWGAEKPYFEIDGEQLTLGNAPVPPRPQTQDTLNFWQRTLGYSYLVDFVLRRLNLMHDWFGDHVRVHPAGTGERIACLLTGRLAELKRSSGAEVVLLAQYDPVVWQSEAFAAEQRQMTQRLLACAEAQGLRTLDSFDALAAWPGDGGPARLYVLWHMSDQGNRLIAELIAEVLK